MLLTGRGRPDTTARLVLAVLAEHAHKDGGGARPSVLRIQYRSGYDRRTIQRALRRLEDAGLISREGEQAGCIVWRLAMTLRRPPEDWTELEKGEEAARVAAAGRQRKSRAKAVTHSKSVTQADVTHPESVTVTHSDDVTTGDVTHFESARHALQVRTSRTSSAHVTHSVPPEPSRTINEPPGTDRSDGRRPTTGSGGERASGSAAPHDHAARVSAHAAAVRTVIARLPAPLRAALARRSRFTPPMLARIITAELDRGLTPDRLAERATDRWHLRGYDTADIRRPVGVAHALLSNACTSPRCDDGTDIDTRQPCRTCDRAREDHLAQAAA